jgi:hypothetical protein
MRFPPKNFAQVSFCVSCPAHYNLLYLLCLHCTKIKVFFAESFSPSHLVHLSYIRIFSIGHFSNYFQFMSFLSLGDLILELHTPLLYLLLFFSSGTSSCLTLSPWMDTHFFQNPITLLSACWKPELVVL